MVEVIKADDSIEEFDAKKIVNSIILAGATKEVANKIAKKVERYIKKGKMEKIKSSEIRRIVLNELEKIAPKVYEAWKYYDWIVKGRVTFDNNKFIEVKKGNLYLGKSVKDIGKRGLDSAKEVKEILKELEEDALFLPKKKVQARTYILWLAVLRNKKMSEREKKRAVRLINEFRKKFGWKPFRGG